MHVERISPARIALWLVAAISGVILTVFFALAGIDSGWLFALAMVLGVLALGAFGWTVATGRVIGMLGTVLAGATTPLGLPAACAALVWIARRRNWMLTFFATTLFGVVMAAPSASFNLESLGFLLAILFALVGTGSYLGLHEAERQRDLNRRAEQARREEREQVTREIQDSVLQRLKRIAEASIGAVGEHERGVIHAESTAAISELSEILEAMSDGCFEELGVRTITEQINAARARGMTVTVTESAPCEKDLENRLSPMAVTALRVTLQEVLANAARHAPGLPVLVDGHWAPGSVHMEFSNPVVQGPEIVPTGSDPGTGLVVVGERIELAGGEMVLNQGDAFTVAVDIPYGAAHSTRRGVRG